MYKKTKLKISRIFLKNNFPENLLPTKKWYKKEKKKLSKKNFYLLRKKIREAEQELLKQYYIALDVKKKQSLLPFIKKQAIYPLQKKNQKPTNHYYLLSLDQLKYQLSKKGGRYKRFSDFNLQLKERKKLSILYGGISTAFLRKICLTPGKITENLLIFLERRLDVVLFRICFFNSIRSARQSISHNRIQVNGKVVNISSTLVKSGDVISILPTKRFILQNLLLKTIKARIFKRHKRFLISTTNKYKSHKPSLFNKVKLLAGNPVLKKKLNPNINILTLIDKVRARKNKKHISFFQSKLLYLKLKKCLYRNRSRGHVLAASSITAMKPVNIEVSFKLLTAIVLYSPQKLAFPALLDFDLIQRSIV